MPHERLSLLALAQAKAGRGVPEDRQEQLRISEAMRGSEQAIFAQRHKYRNLLATLDRLVVGDAPPEEIFATQ
jgi:hypothetical protein